MVRSWIVELGTQTQPPATVQCGSTIWHCPKAVAIASSRSVVKDRTYIPCCTGQLVVSVVAEALKVCPPPDGLSGHIPPAQTELFSMNNRTYPHTSRIINPNIFTFLSMASDLMTLPVKSDACGLSRILRYIGVRSSTCFSHGSSASL